MNRLVFFILIGLLLQGVLNSCKKSNESEEKPVQEIKVTSVSLDKNAMTLTVGDTETLKATVAPANATNRNVSWSSNNTTVVTVANGTLTAIAPGDVTITVTTADGDKTATCKITVNIPPVNPDGDSDNWDEGGKINL